MQKNKKIFVNKKAVELSIKAIVRLIIALAVLFLVVFPACNKLRSYFFGEQIIAGLLNPVEGGKCIMNFNEDHKAVDILSDCGNPVKAACSGTLSGFGPGLSGDPVFGGTSRGGSMGLHIDNLENCKDEDKDWSEYDIIYGCIDFEGREKMGFATRDVKQGEIIGTVGRCNAEPKTGEDGCHVHLVIRKGTLGGKDSVAACEHLKDVKSP